MTGEVVRHRWSGALADTCSREGCGVQRRVIRRPKKPSAYNVHTFTTDVDEYSTDGGATWAELSALGGRVPACRGKGD
jgi:hypothetical protein